MNVLYYSLDEGEQAWKKAQEVLGQDLIVPSKIKFGEILRAGTDLQGNQIHVSGVGLAEKACRLAWIHALEQVGKSAAEWRFHKVNGEKST